MNRRLFTVSMVIATGCAPQPLRGPVAPGPLSSAIDTAAIRGYTRFLSDDALLGRATGTPQADLAALYIQAACIGIGFAPAANRNYLQSVSLQRTTIKSPGTTLTVSGPRGTRSYEYRGGFLPNLGFDGTSGFTGPAVLVGASDDILSGQLGNLDLRGAVAVIAGAAPDPVEDTLRLRGAIALLQLTGDEGQYILYVRSRGDSRLQLTDSAAKRSFGSSLLSVVASPRLSRDLLAGVPMDLPTRLADSVTLTLSLKTPQ